MGDVYFDCKKCGKPFVKDFFEVCELQESQIHIEYCDDCLKKMEEKSKKEKLKEKEVEDLRSSSDILYYDFLSLIERFSDIVVDKIISRLRIMEGEKDEPKS